jgi:cobyric acid synthase
MVDSDDGDSSASDNDDDELVVDMRSAMPENIQPASADSVVSVGVRETINDIKFLRSQWPEEHFHHKT